MHDEYMFLKVESPKCFLCEVVAKEIQLTMESSTIETRWRQPKV